MSKEEILYNAILKAVIQDNAEPIDEPFEQTIQKPSFKILLAAMQEYADQEKEKVVVAFTEWKEEVHEENGSYHFWDNGNHFFFESITDLYKYFITNVYNK